MNREALSSSNDYIILPKVETIGGRRIEDKTEPNSIVKVNGYARKISLHPAAAKAIDALINEARLDGIEHPLLLAVSGYRSIKTQKKLWERALKKYGSESAARKWVAKPGGSAHHSGRAIDFYLGGKNSSKNVNLLRTSDAYKWLEKNAIRFGFYLYPAEPWHWEYNPPSILKIKKRTVTNDTGSGKKSLSEETPSFKFLFDKIKEFLKDGKEEWAIFYAISQEIKDESKLTNLVFFTRHPELNGRAIKPDEKSLAKEWLKIRNEKVRPILSKLS